MKSKKITRKVASEVLWLSGLKLVKVENGIYWIKSIDDPGAQAEGTFKRDFQDYIRDLIQDLINDPLTEEYLNSL